MHPVVDGEEAAHLSHQCGELLISGTGEGLVHLEWVHSVQLHEMLLDGLVRLLWGGGGNSIRSTICAGLECPKAPTK